MNVVLDIQEWNSGSVKRWLAFVTTACSGTFTGIEQAVFFAKVYFFAVRRILNVLSALNVYSPVLKYCTAPP